MSTDFLTRSALRRQSGFTLTELLVGAAIGLIGIIAMFQVLLLWDKMKRSTAAGSDAQIVGTVGYFRLERDVKQAGLGFGAAPANVIGCTVAATVNDPTGAGTQRAFTFLLAPAQIVQGANGSPDSVQVLYGNSTLFAGAQLFKTSTAFTKTTTWDWARYSFRVYRNTANEVLRGDVMLVADKQTPAHCTLAEVSENTGANIEHQPKTAQNRPLRFNGTAGTGATFATDGFLFNMGSQPQLKTWTVTGDTLRVTDLLSFTPTPVTVADGVINLQAEYGVDTNGDAIVDTWQTADPGDWRRLLAIRVAILARSQQYEATRSVNGNDVYATPTAPVLPWLDNGGNAIAFTMRNVDGQDDSNPKTDNDWRNYRYRVYGGVIALRNMLWNVP